MKLSGESLAQMGLSSKAFFGGGSIHYVSRLDLEPEHVIEVQKHPTRAPVLKHADMKPSPTPIPLCKFPS